MWSLYAENGRGFLVEFDTSHEFFKAANGRGLLWRVNYKNENTEFLFENPAALFLSKHSHFSFEREWRFIRELEKCDEIIEVENQKMHMCCVVPGMIKSVTFGYNFRQERVSRARGLAESDVRSLYSDTPRICQ